MSEILSAFPFEAFARGAGLMLSLIVAIGAQNIFVISQGLAKSTSQRFARSVRCATPC